MLDSPVTESIFFGLITHPDSKYLNAFGVHEKFVNLVKDLDVISFFVNDVNVTDPLSEKINIRDEIFSISILFKSLLNTQFRVLLKSNFSNFPLFVYHSLSGIYSICVLFSKLILTQFHPKLYYNYQKMLARQHNISEAHIAQLRNCLHSNLKFSLILEDDFLINRDYLMKDTLSKIVNYMINTDIVKILSISESFSPKLLGFGKVSTYLPFEELDFYILSTPVTNTVSAMFYKTDILNQLIPILKSYRRYKIIPIDHKFNMAFVQLRKINKNHNLALSYLSPGLFIQGSIHDNL